jgi:hypothetical protein
MSQTQIVTACAEGVFKQVHTRLITRALTHTRSRQAKDEERTMGCFLRENCWVLEAVYMQAELAKAIPKFYG